MAKRWITGGRFLLDSIVVALVGFGVLNILSGWLGGRDRNAIWVTGQGARWLASFAILSLAAGLLPRSWVCGEARRSLAKASALLLGTLCFLDGLGFFESLHGGRIETPWPIPLSLLLALVLVAWSLVPEAPVVRHRTMVRHALVRVLFVAAAGGGLVLLHLLTFGATDYRRPADAAIVFGAAVRPDGSPSGALEDRTVTACRLYHAGLVTHLVLSGGRDPAAPLSEPACMAEIARREDVPADALVLDETGRTTDASLATLGRLARERHWTRFLGVSHDYHLARIRLLGGFRDLDLYTVPADETVPWPSKPLFVLREVLAWTWHFGQTALPHRSG